MRAVIFGAGNIGRGFLGLLLHRAGYEITFIDVDRTKIEQLQLYRSYPVHIVSAAGTTQEMVTNFEAVRFDDRANVIRAITRAELVLTAVGKNALAFLAPVLAEALPRRAEAVGMELIVTVIACENVHDNSQYLQHLVIAIPNTGHLQQEWEAMAAFPNCLVDRIVPNVHVTSSENPLAVTVEDYFQFAIDRTALKGPLASIPGVQLTTNLPALLEQKLCTLNAAHAVVAYYGYLRGYRYIHEAVRDDSVRRLVDGVLEEVASLLTTRFPSLTSLDQRAYADRVLHRFENPYLLDEVTRVARQPKRKLSPDDRLVRPAQLLVREGVTIPVYLATGITAALLYDGPGDSEAQELTSELRREGVSRVLERVAQVEPSSVLGRTVAANYQFRAL